MIWARGESTYHACVFSGIVVWVILPDLVHGIVHFDLGGSTLGYVELYAACSGNVRHIETTTPLSYFEFGLVGLYVGIVRCMQRNCTTEWYDQSKWSEVLEYLLTTGA